MAGDTTVNPKDAAVSIETQLLMTTLQSLDRELSNRLETLDKNVMEMKRDFRKILDDHENRLRKSAERDAEQGSEIAQMRVQIAELKASVDAIREDRKVEAARQQTFLQQITMRVIEMAVPSGIIGTIIYLVISGGGLAW